MCQMSKIKLNVIKWNCMTINICSVCILIIIYWDQRSKVKTMWKIHHISWEFSVKCSTFFSFFRCLDIWHKNHRWKYTTKEAQTTALPERIAKLNVDAAVTLPPVCTVHFNLEMTIVSSTCCKSTDGKNLWKQIVKGS